jgi:hypothetical protein
MRYCKWVATTLIPAYFDDNLQPSNTESIRCCTTSTLAQYVGQHLKKIRQDHPQHPDWKDLRASDSPSWWTPMREAFVKESQHFQLSHSGDLIFGATKIRPLYKDNGNKPIRDDSEIKDFIQACDLKYIIRNLVRDATIEGNQKLQQRCWVGMSNSCIGRGGEVKFQDYNEWTYHPLLEVTDSSWTETKTLHFYPMPMVPEKVSWEFDFYHMLGTYHSVENGLYRSQDEINKGLLNSVFPDLHTTSVGINAPSKY